MKTFKLISLHVTGDHGLIEIHLEDGLIINKEDENRTWLLEALCFSFVRRLFSIPAGG